MARRGFTILELSLVLAVILVAAAIGMPAIDAMYEDVRLTAAADMVRSSWAEARAHAVDDGVAYRFSVAPQTGKFRVEPDIDQDGGDMADPDAKPLVIDNELPGGMVFADADVASDDNRGDLQPVVIFLPNGEAQDDTGVVLRGKTSRVLRLRLRALTGAVQITFDNGGG